MIGECNKFDSTDILYYNKKYKHGSFKGIAVQHRKTFKTKKDALAFAKKVQVQNGSFADGSIPFEVVWLISVGLFYLYSIVLRWIKAIE